MNEQLRMFTLSSYSFFDTASNPESDKQLIGYLTAGLIVALRELGGEDNTELAHILAEAALASNRLDESGKETIQYLINNEGANELQD